VARTQTIRIGQGDLFAPKANSAKARQPTMHYSWDSKKWQGGKKIFYIFLGDSYRAQTMMSKTITMNKIYVFFWQAQASTKPCIQMQYS
jgi:hypothetical protein